MALAPIQIPWTTKPPLGTPIDWSNPLTQGLVGAWAFNEGGGAVATNACGTRSGAITGPVWGKNGLTLSGSGNYASIPYDKNLHVGIGSTIIVVGKARSLSVASRLFATDVNGSTYTGISLFVNTTGYIECQLGTGGTPGAASRRNTVATSNPIVAGTGITATVVVNSFNGANSLYVNGKLCTSSTAGTGASFSAGASASEIGRFYSGAYGYSDFRFEESLIYNRPLLVSEVQSLHINPWQIYQPQTIWVPIADVAAGGFLPFWAINRSQILGGR